MKRKSRGDRVYQVVINVIAVLDRHDHPVSADLYAERVPVPAHSHPER